MAQKAPPQAPALALVLEAFPGSWTGLSDSMAQKPSPQAPTLALALEAFPGS